MSKATTLRLREVRDAYRLIGECQELGGEPGLWHNHMLQGLARIVGTVHAASGEARWCRPGGTLQPLSTYDVSADPAIHEVFVSYHQAKGPLEDPVYCALQHVPGRLVTRTRPQLVPDAVWHRSESYLEYRRPARIAHELVSVCQRSDDGATSVIGLNRAQGERDFSSRERRLVHFFHAEIARLIGGLLASVTGPNAGALPPRLRQTLACLLEGDSEKQVAARLGLSVATVHDYVTTLYRRFGVKSRAQLLSRVLRRVPGGISL